MNFCFRRIFRTIFVNDPYDSCIAFLLFPTLGCGDMHVHQYRTRWFSVMFYSCWFAGICCTCFVLIGFTISTTIFVVMSWVCFITDLVLKPLLVWGKMNSTYSKIQSGQKQRVGRYGYTEVNLNAMNIYKICAQRLYCFHKISKKSSCSCWVLL